MKFIRNHWYDLGLIPMTGTLVYSNDQLECYGDPAENRPQ